MTNDPLARVHPELRDAAKIMQGFQIGEWNAENLRLARSREVAGSRLAEVPVSEMLIPGGPGDPEVAIFVINAKPGTSRPGIVYMHAGGFIMGRASGEIRFLQELVQSLDCAIVAVDYRLAPETTWAGSLEDNYAGLKWLHTHAPELGVDPTKLAVMGRSAGGGHAALLAVAARDRGEISVMFQSLTYPMLDDRTGSARSVPDHIGFILWTAEANRFGWRSFLGLEPGSNQVPHQAVPARIDNLSGLPPAWIGVGGLDLFVDEDVQFARRLIDIGISVELLVVPGAFHAFDLVPGPRVSREFAKSRVNGLRRAFGLESIA